MKLQFLTQCFKKVLLSNQQTYFYRIFISDAVICERIIAVEMLQITVQPLQQMLPLYRHLSCLLPLCFRDSVVLAPSELQSHHFSKAKKIQGPTPLSLAAERRNLDDSDIF